MRLLLMYRCRYLNLKGVPWRLSLSITHQLHPDVDGETILHQLADIHPPGEFASLKLVVTKDWVDRVWKTGWSVIEGQLVLSMRIIGHSSNSGIATILKELDGKHKLAVHRSAEVARSDTMKPFVVRWL